MDWEASFLKRQYHRAEDSASKCRQPLAGVSTVLQQNSNAGTKRMLSSIDSFRPDTLGAAAVGIVCADCQLLNSIGAGCWL